MGICTPFFSQKFMFKTSKTKSNCACMLPTSDILVSPRDSPDGSSRDLNIISKTTPASYGHEKIAPFFVS